jgi:hypothetical protein
LLIGLNGITSIGLDDTMRIIKLTQLKKISLCGSPELFSDEDATQHFVTTLQRTKSFVQDLPGIRDYIRATTYASIQSSLIRKEQLNRVALLLVPPPLQRRQHATSTMLKTPHKAIAEFAMVPNNAGASAIFKLFEVQPTLLEKRLKRPPPRVAAATTADAAAAASQQDCSTISSTSILGSSSSS